MSASHHPLREAHVWISVLWALALAVGLAAWDAGELRFKQAAAAQHALLLPAQELSQAQRLEERDRIAKEAGVAGAQWISPADQSSRLARQYSGKTWSGMFSDEQSWVPWVLEIGFANPLNEAEALTAFAARRANEPAWAVMTWDNERLGTLRQARTQMRAVLAIFLIFVLLAGGVALLSTPAPGGKSAAAGTIWRGVLGVGMPGAVLAVGWISGLPLSARTATVALAAGFVVAALVSPMLRQVRGRQLSVSVGEGREERPAP